MSWEVIGKSEHPCPCGKGFCYEVTEMNDWNKTRIEHEMACPECKEMYVYSKEQVGYKPYHTRDKGWVIK